MATLSETTVSVILPSGNRAVYSVGPQFLNPIPGVSLNQRAIMYGDQLAVRLSDRWYKTGGKVEIDDRRLIALLELTPDARDIEAHQQQFIG